MKGQHAKKIKKCLNVSDLMKSNSSWMKASLLQPTRSSDWRIINYNIKKCQCAEDIYEGPMCSKCICK